MSNSKNTAITETSGNKKTGFVDVFFFVIIIGLACFHLYTAYFGVLERSLQVGIHWAGIGTVLVLTRPY